MSPLHHKGFTLIETLVALAILTVGLIPVFQQATSATTLSTTIKNSLIAANLAQEGVEVVRSIRDARWLAKPLQPFLQLANTCIARFCSVQYNSTSVGSESGPLLLDSNGLYGYRNGGAPTPFKRAIKITQAPGGTPQLIVTSTVTWDERGVHKSFAVEYHLYDWLQQ